MNWTRTILDGIVMCVIFLSYQHSRLYREHTIACGRKLCDYRSVGDKTDAPQ